MALLLSWALGSVPGVDSFHFGEQNGASLGAKIENGKLVYALKNASTKPWTYMVHMRTGSIPMYDNLDLVVIDQNQMVHHFGFVSNRDGSGPIFKTLEPGDTYQESIDLSIWNQLNFQAIKFRLNEGEIYQVYLHYSWVERRGNAEIHYGPLDSKVFKMTVKKGTFVEVDK